jgi:hypothetical protein
MVMPTIFNKSKFDVWIAAIDKHLAPYESVVVADVKVAEQLVKTGILSNDLKALEGIGADVANLIQTWHDEHAAPADQVVDHDAEPVEPAKPAPVVPAPATRTAQVQGAQVVESDAKPDIETRG